jgi:hypothetical protein
MSTHTPIALTAQTAVALQCADITTKAKKPQLI